MDKSILKRFAIESRKDLVEKIKNKINTFYIDEEFTKEQKGEVYVLSNEKHSLSLTNEEYQKRELLIKRIKELSLEQVIEEAAYTWFNRIIAIRYMEINDYLPLTKDNQSLGIRVLSSKDNTPDPEILKFTNLVNPDLDIDFNKEKYAELKNDNEKFKYVLLLVCKKLGRAIPQVFDGVTDYIDILIPDNLLNDTGFITKIISEVPESNYSQVEIIGWLYQYYNQTEKDKLMSSNKVYSKIEIPYVTQIFTPDWIVKYMVENSLGRYCVNNNLVSIHYANKNWKYYINNSEIQNKNGKLEDIKFIDPCCGSGHILVYAFELLYNVYIENGFNKMQICEYIFKNNLYGIDIDDRAGQLSLLAVILKAREYDKNVFNKNIIQDINIISMQESHNINITFIEDILSDSAREKAMYLNKIFKSAKELGSLIEIDNQNYDEILDELNKNDNLFKMQLRNEMFSLVKQANILKNKYTIVVTNPPYMGIRLMDKILIDYLEKNYSTSKYDLFSAMLYKWSKQEWCSNYCSMITPMAWAFLDSYSLLRKHLIENNNFNSFLHLGIGTFGADLGMVSFVIDNCNTSENTIFINLTECKDSYDKEKNFQNKNLRIEKNIRDFNKFPGYQFGYWIQKEIQNLFENEKLLCEYAEPRQGLATGNNDLFLRKWYEVNYNKIGFNFSSLDAAKSSKKKWFPFNKGGDFRKWYGNNEYLVNWENDGMELKQFAAKKYKSYTRTIKNINYYFKKGITWSTISSKAPSFRAFDEGFIISNSGQGIYLNNEKYYFYLLGILNTNYSSYILNFLSPTLGFESGYIRKIPVKIIEQYLPEIDNLVKKNINLEKINWDNKEISWDFGTLNIIKNKEKNISKTIEKIIKLDNDNIIELNSNENKLNELYNKILSIDNVIINKVDKKFITYDICDKKENIKKLISYAVGCMFGRYSLEKEGLIYAGGDFDEIYKKCKKTDGGWAGVSLSNYKVLNDNGKEIDLSFEVDNDNVIPITDEAYFSDDIVERFKKFISVVYGKETLNENLDFIAETLGKKGTETSEDTIRRYFVNDFFNDHVKIYQKRPIYWLFDSGKKNGFKALIYMHRYNENLVPKIRLDYLHRVQTTYEKLLSDINYKLTTELSMTDKKETQKKQADLNAKLQEIKEYDEKIAHIANQRISIDLDDGVKVNYENFKDILAKIR